METFRHLVADDFSPKDLPGFMAGLQLKFEQPGYQTWSISVDGELVGLIAMEKLSPWLGTAHWILKPDFHGKGVARKASMIAVTEMFESGIGKLSFYPLDGNWAMFSLLKSLGAQHEGMLRGQTLSDGKPVDMHLYGLMKEEFYAVCRVTAVSASDRGRSGIDYQGDRGDQGPDLKDDRHQHTDALPGITGDHDQAPGVPAGNDRRPEPGIGADPQQCAGGD